MATAFSSCAFLVFYFLCFHAEVHAQEKQMCSPAAEEGTDYTLYNTNWNGSLSGRLVWRFTLFGQDTLISANDLVRNETFEVFSLDNFTVLNDPARGIIISNITRSHATTYRFLVDGTTVFSCELQVYKRPSTMSCTEVKVDSFNTFTTSCNTAEVFPEASCKLYVKSKWTDTTINYSHSRSFKDPEYNTSTCDIRYDVTGMEAGIHTVTVSMFPDATGLNETFGATETSLYFRLIHPRVMLTYCPDGSNVTRGYILQGTTATCTCRMLNKAVPEGKIHWSSPDGNFSIETEAHGRNVKIRINGAGTFTCQATSALQGPYRKHTFSLKTAYGPSRTEISHNATGPVDLCPSTDVSVRVQCSVDKSDVQSEPTFELYSGQQSRIELSYLDSATSEKYTQNYIYHPVVGGSHTLTCVARNSAFGQISARNSTTLEVRAPPITDPVIRLGNGTDDTCTVMGGVPPVESVTFKCDGHETVTAIGTSVSLSKDDVPPSHNWTTCVCYASHVTQCYHLTSKLRIRLLDSGDSYFFYYIICFVLFPPALVVALVIQLRQKGKRTNLNKKHHKKWYSILKSKWTTQDKLQMIKKDPQVGQQDKEECRFPLPDGPIQVKNGRDNIRVPEQSPKLNIYANFPLEVLTKFMIMFREHASNKKMPMNPEPEPKVHVNVPGPGVKDKYDAMSF